MTASADYVDCVVIGAGVVGLAVARSMAQAGREVIVLDAAAGIGTQTSARNSEVVHAGIYYPSGSLKAMLCVRGKALLYDYCQSRHVAHSRCGKLIVATSFDQLPALQAIQAKALANGVADLVTLDRLQAMAMEPHLQCVGALLSPSTGIVDSHGLMLSFLADIEACGGVLALNSPVAHVSIAYQAIEIIANEGMRLVAKTVINAAGHGAVALAAAIQGMPAGLVPKAFFAKGSYFSLAGKNPFTRLIYPVPEVGGLGVHLTLDLGGQARFGPDVEWVRDADDLAVDAQRAAGFYAEIRKYWPGLADNALEPAYAGIRPKISGPDDLAADFLIQGPQAHGVPGLVHLFGIESPGLTSALAIGEYVAKMDI